MNRAASADPASPRADLIRFEQIAVLYRNAPPGMIASFVAASVLAILLVQLDSVSVTIAVVFIGCMAAHTAARLLLVRAFHRAAPSSSDWSRWARIFSASTFIGGLTWGIGALFLMAPAQIDHQPLVLLVLAGVGAGAVSAFASHLKAFLLYFVPSMLPSMAWSAVQGDVLHAAFAAFSAVWTLAMCVVARSLNASIMDSLRLRFENIELLDDLRQQKELAEQANTAKSRFLAAASHDLRQPVHALGLFVGALRGHALTDGARGLVARIENSVSALDDLFAALLDMSKLDAGVVRSTLIAFPIQTLLARICDDYATEAAQKGVALRLLPCSVIVHSDPVLLERILRNLVSNAVRYTARGRIVVGCRRGRRLSLQVWDTGLGIPHALSEKIFQEFYQVENPERDRGKGLGLGLAIVRRLAALLECAVTLDSVPGRGSVFKVAVPIAVAAAAPVSSAPDMPRTDLARKLIVVIDDESAIQDAMAALLRGWGHDVVTSGSGAEIHARLADHPARPDLIISDFRLRGAETGIAVIASLRAAYNAAIPAMLITGDIAQDRLVEAERSGLLLLHKPVPNAKLRAAITSLLRAPAPVHAGAPHAPPESGSRPAEP